MINILKKEFEKKVTELGYIFSNHREGFYILQVENGGDQLKSIQLIGSQPSKELLHHSKNGNDIQVVGVFKIKLPPDGQEPDLFIFNFGHPFKKQAEYLIIPKEEFKRRFLNKNLGYNLGKRVEIVFWLMPDGCVYNTTHLSPEGEWYFLSKGTNGRMADETDMNYTMFLNSWRNMMLR